MSAIELRNIVKRYGAVEAVKGVSLAINSGEFVVLVGPSGCGKSTTLRMIAGLEDITSGEIAIGGRVVNRLEPKDRNIAMVFQNYAIYPHMTVAKNIGFGLRTSKLTTAEKAWRITQTAETLGLTELLERRPAALSGGQRQRVAIGRAMVRDPDVFLFDEPLSNLDAQLRTQMRLEIKKLHQSLQRTIVFVTHDQIEAMTLADRIVIMKDGVVQQVGTPDAVYRRPANTFVARFIGSPSMNLLPTQMEDDRLDGTGLDVSGLGRIPATGVTAKTVSVGIRPDDLRFVRTTTPGLLVTSAVVKLVEPLGPDALIYAQAAGQDLVAKAFGRDVPQTGERVQLAFDRRDVHVFDAGSGVALMHGV